MRVAGCRGACLLSRALSGQHVLLFSAPRWHMRSALGLVRLGGERRSFPRGALFGRVESDRAEPSRAEKKAKKKEKAKKEKKRQLRLKRAD